MKLHQKIFGIGLLTAVIVPHLYEKGYSSAQQMGTVGKAGTFASWGSVQFRGIGEGFRKTV